MAAFEVTAEDLVSGDLKRLEGNHHFVIFHKIPNQHQDLLSHDGILLFGSR